MKQLSFLFQRRRGYINNYQFLFLKERKWGDRPEYTKYQV